METAKTRHEKMREHLREATKKLHHQQLEAQRNAQAHLDSRRPTPPLS